VAGQGYWAKSDSKDGKERVGTIGEMCLFEKKDRYHPWNRLEQSEKGAVLHDQSGGECEARVSFNYSTAKRGASQWEISSTVKKEGLIAERERVYPGKKGALH